MMGGLLFSIGLGYGQCVLLSPSDLLIGTCRALTGVPIPECNKDVDVDRFTILLFSLAVHCKLIVVVRFPQFGAAMKNMDRDEWQGEGSQVHSYY